MPASRCASIALGHAGALADDVGPEASAEAESREEAKPRAPRDLEQARAQDFPPRRRLRPEWESGTRSAFGEPCVGSEARCAPPSALEARIGSRARSSGDRSARCGRWRRGAVVCERAGRGSEVRALPWRGERLGAEPSIGSEAPSALEAESAHSPPSRERRAPPGARASLHSPPGRDLAKLANRPGSCRGLIGNACLLETRRPPRRLAVGGALGRHPSVSVYRNTACY